MEYVFLVAILLFSAVLHEISHGAIAYSLGDQTAKNAGRLTLNPIPHIDPIGSILLPALLILANTGIVFGWAKPVPVNPYYFRDQKWGSLKVSIAGPATNLLLAVVFGLILRFLPIAALNPTLAFFFGLVVYVNILLAVFNLLPVPPLDGSHILFSFFPRSWDAARFLFSQYGFFLLLIFLFFFSYLISPVIRLIFQLIVGIPF